MDNRKFLNPNFERVGWGLLSILWGIVILVDFVPFEAGLIGTGLIMLSVAGANNRLSLKNDSTVVGILMLAWGGLEFTRPLLHQLFPSADLDWVIFAVLLIGWGVILSASWFERKPSEEASR
jgi:hypothetical protein